MLGTGSGRNPDPGRRPGPPRCRTRGWSRCAASITSAPRATSAACRPCSASSAAEPGRQQPAQPGRPSSPAANSMSTGGRAAPAATRRPSRRPGPGAPRASSVLAEVEGLWRVTDGCCRRSSRPASRRTRRSARPGARECRAPASARFPLPPGGGSRGAGTAPAPQRLAQVPQPFEVRKTAGTCPAGHRAELGMEPGSLPTAPQQQRLGLDVEPVDLVVISRTTGSAALMASTAAWSSRNSSVKMPASGAVAAWVTGRRAAGAAAGVVPLVQRPGLVQALEALQPDRACRRSLPPALVATARSCRARGPLDQDRLAELPGQPQHEQAVLVGEGRPAP